MAVHRHTAILDACVLYPAPLRDLLLSLAVSGIYQARWTRIIQDEWIRKLSDHRPDLRQEALERTASLMNAAIKDSIVENFEHLIDALVLPDPNDRHVLAAAIASQATTIVTFNTKDFPASCAVPATHPDNFLTSQYAMYPRATLEAIGRLRQRLRNPPKTAQQIISTYALQGLPKFCEILRGSTDLF
jgi:predicted nucleic acid-binding protein